MNLHKSRLILPLLFRSSFNAPEVFPYDPGSAQLLEHIVRQHGCNQGNLDSLLLNQGFCLSQVFYQWLETVNFPFFPRLFGSKIMQYIDFKSQFLSFFNQNEVTAVFMTV